MLLHLLWFLPAALFAIRFYREPRSLFNAYLLSFTLLMLGIVLAGYTVVSIERFIGHNPAIICFYILALMIPISVLSSTLYLIFNGRQMMTLEGRRLANLLSLIYGLGILGLIGLHSLTMWPAIPYLLPLVDSLIFYATFLYLSYIIYAFFCNLFPVKKEPKTIIILGSGLIGDQVPPLLAQRLDKGKAIYEKFDQRPRIIVSGGQGSDERLSEAEAMAAYLIARGIPEDHILIENKSRTTFENLTFSQQLMIKQGYESDETILVTNSFHALRAGIYMKCIGLKGRSIGSRTAFYFLPSAWIRETVGLFAMYWKWHLLVIILLLLPLISSWIHSVLQLFF